MSATETAARRSAANIADPLSRAALEAQLGDVQAFLAGIAAGFDAATPAGMQVSPSVGEQLGSAQLALRFLADMIALGGVHTDLIKVGDEPPAETPNYVYLTADDFEQRIDAARLNGWAAGIVHAERVPA